MAAQRGGAAAGSTSLPKLKNEPGHVLTVRVKNEPSTSQQSRLVAGKRCVKCGKYVSHGIFR